MSKGKVNKYIDKSDDYRANVYTFKCIAVSIGIIGVTWILNMLNIFIIDQELVNTTFVGVVISFALAFTLKSTLGFDKKVSSYIMLFLVVAMFSFANMIVSYHAVLFVLMPLLCSFTYNNKRYEVYTFILSSIGIIVGTVGGFYMGLCDANMLILTTGRTENYISTISHGITQLNSDPVKLIVYFAAPKILTLYGFSVMMRFIRTVISDATRKEVEMRRLAETDALTGINNRNKYKTDVDEYISRGSNVAVIYVDVNNLKVINDTKGHEQGDVLIIGTADILRSFQSDRCSSYRMGGDEFVVLLENPSDNETENLINEIREAATAAKLDYDLKLSIAIGSSEGPSADIKALLKEADEKMYLDKVETKK